MRNKPVSSDPTIGARAVDMLKESFEKTLNSVMHGLKTAVILFAVSFVVGMAGRSFLLASNLLKPIYDLAVIGVGDVGMF